MMKRVLTAAALAAVLAVPAFAQQPMSKSDTVNQNSATMSASAGFVQQQTPTEWRGSKLIGANVYGPDNNSIGEINDVTTAIAAAVEEQGAATREIARNIQQAAGGTSEPRGSVSRELTTRVFTSMNATCSRCGSPNRRRCLPTRSAVVISASPNFTASRKLHGRCRRSLSISTRAAAFRSPNWRRGRGGSNVSAVLMSW